VMTWHLCVIVKVVCAAVLDSGDGAVNMTGGNGVQGEVAYVAVEVARGRERRRCALARRY